MSTTRYSLNALFLFVLLGVATAADGTGPQLAQRYFEEAKTICERDAGRLWGVSLCGPMVVFDQATGTRATSQPEPEGPPPAFRVRGRPGLLGRVAVVQLALVHAPGEKDADVRQQVMLHGLFHRIQAELGLTPSDGFNEHLDTLEGRI